jgi:hypothetical protein
MLQQPPAPPAAPALPSVNISRASASDVYVAAKNQRSELRSQLSQLEEKRTEWSNTLGDSDTPEAAKAGLTQRIKELDGRIANLDQQIAQADAAVAQAAALPGAIVESKPAQRDGPPDEVYAVPIVFTMFVLAPIAIAYARRIWKRPLPGSAQVNPAMQDKLNQLTDAVESIGLEVERIGEGQRFITKVFTETNARAIGAGAAQPIPVPARGEQVAVAKARS